MTREELNEAVAWIDENVGTLTAIAFRKAMETCSSGKNVQGLTWQDVRKIVEIADDIVDYDTYKNRHTGEEEYYKQVLKKFEED